MEKNLQKTVSGLGGVRGIRRIYFERSGDQPVPGDYDGDGNDDSPNGLSCRRATLCGGFQPHPVRSKILNRGL